MAYAPEPDGHEAHHSRKTGLFLTDDGLGLVESIYKERLEDRSHDDGSIAWNAVKVLFADEWRSFDDVYAGLYAANIDHRGIQVSPDPDFPTDGWATFLLEFLLSTSFPHVERSMALEQTLLDEFAVANVINFKKALTDIVPYSIKLTRVGTGCLYLGFTVFALQRGESGDGIEGGLPGLDVEALDNGSEWALLRENFGVEKVHFQALK